MICREVIFADFYKDLQLIFQICTSLNNTYFDEHEACLALELKLCYILGFYDAAQLYHKL